MGATLVLEQRLGGTLAAEMFLTGRSYRGEELARRGASVTVVPAADVLPTALDLARSIAAKPAEAVAEVKAELAGRLLARLPEIVEREARMHERVLEEIPWTWYEEHFRKVRDYAARRPPLPAPTEAPAAPPDAVPEAAPVPAPAPTSRGGGAAGRRPRRPRFPTRRRSSGWWSPRSARSCTPPRRRSTVSSASASWAWTRSARWRSMRSLNQRFGLEIDSVAVYDHPTVVRLTAHVLETAERARALHRSALAPAPGPAPVSEPAFTPEPAPAPVSAAPKPPPATEPVSAASKPPAATEPPAVSPVQPAPPVPVTLPPRSPLPPMAG